MKTELFQNNINYFHYISGKLRAKLLEREYAPNPSLAQVYEATVRAVKMQADFLLGGDLLFSDPEFRQYLTDMKNGSENSKHYIRRGI